MGRVKNLQSLESEGKCMETPTKLHNNRKKRQFINKLRVV